ncbi:hypothetical protein F53441_10177 [Fusarium austroafricanum]|uniref:Azaphilone pigments biosynthesis cluster protein L N-terminal domain-containing protein n=1 Tax=Fusarium austroafricanum TaxID=2364996 RepID=A0A8H4KA73_9HYPO|nr:hypothetical protein F53441_10177 [Fusarium austroafricanum]
MEAVGAGASIATFLTIAFSVTKSIHETLCAIKDGPQLIAFLRDEVAQLQGVLQRLSRVSLVSVDASDISELEGLAKKCQDDLVGFASKLQSLDASSADGRKERFWRKVKQSLAEKDLDQIRHVVRGHVQILTVRLNLIQIQQGSFTATQSTQIFGLLQQLRQDVAALQISATSRQVSADESTFTQPMIKEPNEKETEHPPGTSLDESINRLMLLLEKKPCVVESDDSQELIEDLECLLQSIQRDARLLDSKIIYQPESDDVSKEMKLITSLVLSAPSMRINKHGPARPFTDTRHGFRVSQEKKRKTINGHDGIVTINVTKRRRKLISCGENDQDNGELTREFLTKLTYESKSKKKMLSLWVNQNHQLLFDSFMTQEGSVEELLKFIAGGRASLHDHDTNGWSLLHNPIDDLS